MKILFTILVLNLCFLQNIQAQNKYSIKGKIINKNTRQSIDYINIQLVGYAIGAVSDINGDFEIQDITPGIYQLKASSIGYKSITTPDYIISNKSLNILIELEESTADLQDRKSVV